jgi:predicted 3-demethylubiquinone-9 3-methyltransferase (glyoxalase superfamily)
MNNNIHPCLWFNGNAKEAATFYCSIFPHSAITTDTPMVVNFKLSEQKFMALNGGPQFTFNSSISFFVICEEEAEVNELWQQLSENGKIMMSLDKYDWSEKYGFVQDRFGLCWQIMKGKYTEVNQKITPSLLFTGNTFRQAEKAVKFYTEVFPQSSIDGILFYASHEGEAAGAVKHSQFIIDKKVFMAMDAPGNLAFAFNEAISFVVDCETQDEIDTYWHQLTADGGKESQCGWLKDKFGVSWQIVPSILGKLMTNTEKAPSVMQAFMKMKKFNIEALLKA